MLGTYQGSVQPVHPRAYREEFCFRFDYRNSRKRGMLLSRLTEQSVAAPLVTRANVLRRSVPESKPTTPPDIDDVHANALDSTVRPKPWRRAAEMQM